MEKNEDFYCVWRIGSIIIQSRAYDDRPTHSFSGEEYQSLFNFSSPEKDGVPSEACDSIRAWFAESLFSTLFLISSWNSDANFPENFPKYSQYWQWTWVGPLNTDLSYCKSYRCSHHMYDCIYWQGSPLCFFVHSLPFFSFWNEAFTSWEKSSVCNALECPLPPSKAWWTESYNRYQKTYNCVCNWNLAEQLCGLITNKHSKL